jgi:tetratricopeptide (TPR) repeat protein
MSRESLIYAVSGTFFGLLMGWILGSQAARSRAPEPVAPQAAATAPQPGAAAGQAPRPLDTQRAASLEQRAGAEPTNADVRIELANLYFDADRFDLAVPWYQAALKLVPQNVDVSTDLATSLYAVNRVDEAIAQADYSLKLDPNHAKTLLNRGLFLAFGRQDLDGAAQSWERVIQIAPDSEEARRAKQGLDGIRSAHSGGGGAGSGTGSGGAAGAGARSGGSGAGG